MIRDVLGQRRRALENTSSIADVQRVHFQREVRPRTLPIPVGAMTSTSEPDEKC